MRRFNIYPSLLNDFSLYLDGVGEEFGRAWVTEKDLLDRINRVKRFSTAMSKGTIFEDAVRLRDPSSFPREGLNRIIGVTEDGKPVEVSDFVLREAAARYQPGIWQVYCESFLEVGGNLVKVYGYVDNVRRNIATDIKTTSQIKYHDKRKQYQHSTYLLSLESMGCRSDYFEYFITDFNDYTIERYNNSPERLEELRDVLSRFIDFLLLREELITDKKIFGIDTVTHRQ